MSSITVILLTVLCIIYVNATQHCQTIGTLLECEVFANGIRIPGGIQMIKANRMTSSVNLKLTPYRHLYRFTVVKTELTCDDVIRFEYTTVQLNQHLCRV